MIEITARVINACKVQLAQGKDSIVREAEASLLSLKYSGVFLEYRPSPGVVKLASTLGVTKIGNWELKDNGWFNQAGEILELDKQETPRDTAIETRLTVVQF